MEMVNINSKRQPAEHLSANSGRQAESVRKSTGAMWW
jgi:hypothetical protein